MVCNLTVLVNVIKKSFTIIYYSVFFLKNQLFNAAIHGSKTGR